MLQKYNKYILSMSLGNLHSGAGGVDKYVITQKNIAKNKNIGYIYLFYVKKAIKNNIILFRFGLIIDGKYLGVYSTNQIKKMLKDNNFNIESIYINHLWYGKISEVEKIISSINCNNIYYILHDYYTCCSNYTLYENDKYCIANKLGDNVCKTCSKYKYSLKLEKNIWRLINRFIDKITFISPSNCTKNIFLKFHSNIESSNVVVIPNQNVIFENINSSFVKNSKLRIAFLGLDNPAKGWNEFKELVDKFKNTYDFYTFNCYDKRIDGAKLVKAKYDKDHINGMVDFLKEENIDVVILWAKWPETFSYVATESLASKCYMIAYKDSGNIVDIINKHNSGKVYNSFEELLDDMANYKEFYDKVISYRESISNLNIKIEDNINIVNETNGNKLEKELTIKLPSNNLHLLNRLLNIYVKKKFNMEDI